MDEEIIQGKKDLINRMDSMEKTLAHNRQRLGLLLDNSTETGYLNQLGILQAQGVALDVACMELVIQAKNLKILRQIIKDGV